MKKSTKSISEAQPTKKATDAAIAVQTAQPTDALALWSKDPALTTAASIAAIRLDGNERLVIPFTASVVRVKVHYLNSASIRDYTHCNGDGCILCRLARQPETRDLLPVYDAVDKVVGVLPISTNLRANSLRPQLMAVLQRLKDQPRVLLGLRKADNVRFTVATYDLPENADDGADVILRFMEDFDAGKIDLGSVFTRLSNDELAAIPEIAGAMTLKGIKAS